MEIPWEALDPVTLKNLLEEYVSREGTDYGHEDYSLQQKVDRVRQQLVDGAAVIVYDSELQSCNIVEHGSLQHRSPPAPDQSMKD